MENLKRLLKKTIFYKIYKHSYFHKIRRRKFEIQKEEEKRIIEKYFKEMKVIGGPFKGMKYINESFCSTLLPKLNGSYEKEIQDWFNFSENKYSEIIDIGGAEGYYAVGLAKKFPHKRIIYYDIDEKATKLCLSLSKLNEVKNIEMRRECKYSDINYFLPNSLIICDIEGAEESLLNNKKANFKNKTLIIEAHELYKKKIVNLLIKRFKETHNIEIRYNSLKKVDLIHDEKRTGYTPWIKLTPKNG